MFTGMLRKINQPSPLIRRIMTCLKSLRLILSSCHGVNHQQTWFDYTGFVYHIRTAQVLASHCVLNNIHII